MDRIDRVVPPHPSCSTRFGPRRILLHARAESSEPHLCSFPAGRFPVAGSLVAFTTKYFPSTFHMYSVRTEMLDGIASRIEILQVSLKGHKQGAVLQTD